MLLSDKGFRQQFNAKVPLAQPGQRSVAEMPAFLRDAPAVPRVRPEEAVTPTQLLPQPTVQGPEHAIVGPLLRGQLQAVARGHGSGVEHVEIGALDRGHQHALPVGLEIERGGAARELDEAAELFAGAEVQFPQTGYYEIWARATDSAGRAQPMVLPGWNPKGYLNNACHRIAVLVSG